MLLLRRNGADACHFIWPERMNIFGNFQNTGMEVQVRFKSDTECWPGIHFCILQANGIKFEILRKMQAHKPKTKIWMRYLQMISLKAMQIVLRCRCIMR